MLRTPVDCNRVLAFSPMRRAPCWTALALISVLMALAIDACARERRGREKATPEAQREADTKAKIETKAKTKASAPPESAGKGARDARMEPPRTGSLPAQGHPCDDDHRCAEGLTCVEFYGIAGANGPSMTSCEIRCKADKACPDGQHCVTVSDGPGQVCRPDG